MKIPKIEGIQLVEWKGGFALSPIFANDTVIYSTITLGRRVVKHRLPILEAYFGNRECWVISRWVSFAPDDEELIWDHDLVMDPDDTEETARGVFQGASDFWNSDEPEEVAKTFKPSVQPMHFGDISKFDHRRQDLYKARMEVLKDISPKTAALVYQAESATDEQTRARLNEEAVQSYFAELAAIWSEGQIKGWQERNPLGSKWIAEFAKCFRKPVPMVDSVNYDLAANWVLRKYNQLTPEQLAEAVTEATGEKITADAVRQRHYRKLGLMTERKPGQSQKENLDNPS